jgi:hypothetical protein
MSQNLGQRPLHAEDVARLAQQIRDLGPARFQEAEFWGPEILALGFYAHQMTWLEIRLDARAPTALLQSAEGRAKSTAKPLTLFLRSHFLGHVISHVEAPPEFGRVLRLYFPLERWLEVRLFPHGVNVIAYAEGKSVALHKPQPLKELDLAQLTKPPTAPKADVPPPTGNRAPRPEDPALAARRKQLNKLEKTRQKIIDELNVKRDEIWQTAGDWLKQNQSLQNPPAELAACFDDSQSFSWNLSHCFEKAKAQRAKAVGTSRRLADIERQLQELLTPDGATKVQKKAPPGLLAAAKAHGRTIELAPEHTFYVGKSAADNLRLLRAAKPWHLWLHLKDYPGSHGILQRNKGKVVPERLLHAAANHLLRVQFGDKASKYDGDKFVVLVAECRHVRPIKGDRLGRVTYSDAQTLTHRFQNSLSITK